MSEHETTIDLRPWVENWWKQTGNPLYAWEAIARSMNSGESPPAWASSYLKDAAEKMRLLALGRDFRRQDLPRISPAQAKALVGEALELWGPRKKNAFAKRADDAKAAHAALDMDEAKARVDRGGRTILYVKNG
ncbi:MAG: hypothetical protein ACREFQ_05055, partial [Stellaceae bacterium]